VVGLPEVSWSVGNPNTSANEMDCSGVHFSVRVDSFAGGAAGGDGVGFAGSTSQRQTVG
jgi:hypothetical protein